MSDSSLLRAAFKMKLKPGFEEEYQKRHDAIWPRLAKLLKDAGISDYSIFLDPETLTLFGVQKLTPGNSADRLPEEAIMKEWWDYMADLMDVNPDHSPKVTPLKEVFYLE